KARQRVAVHRQQDVAAREAGLFGVRAGLDRLHADRPEQGLHSLEPQRRALRVLLEEAQTGVAQISIVIELGGARYVVAEKRVKAGELRRQVRDSLFQIGASEKPAAPGKVLIQAAHDVVETTPVAGRVADGEVEKEP